VDGNSLTGRAHLDQSLYPNTLFALIFFKYQFDQTLATRSLGFIMNCTFCSTMRDMEITEITQ